MKAQGIPDFFIRRSRGVVGQAPPPIPTFIDTALAIDELPPSRQGATADKPLLRLIRAVAG
jgi:hypothetical protein